MSVSVNFEQFFLALQWHLYIFFKSCSISGEINYPNSKRHLHIQRLYNIFPASLFWDKFIHIISWAKLCQTVRYSPSSILNMMKPNNWGLSWAGPSLASAGTGYWNLSLKRFRETIFFGLRLGLKTVIW